MRYSKTSTRLTEDNMKRQKDKTATPKVTGDKVTTPRTTQRKAK